MESDPVRREGGKGSDAAEYVIVGAHGVVPYEQVAPEGLVVEVAFKAAHRSFVVVAHDVSGICPNLCSSYAGVGLSANSNRPITSYGIVFLAHSRSV